jgi:hypothetical protein
MEPTKTYPKPDALARMLSQAFGEEVAESKIRADIEAGAPVEADGGINVLNYTAWLLKHGKASRPEEA